MQPDSVYIKVSWRPIFKKMRYCLVFYIAKRKKKMIHAMIYDLLFTIVYMCSHDPDAMRWLYLCLYTAWVI